jgi:F-type H+-transporting ATPase subunit alpha
MVEVLKQDQFVPQPLEDQVVLIFAGGQGYPDDLPVSEVRRFEAEFKEFLEYPDVPAKIAQTRDLSPDVQETLHGALKAFKGKFKV